MTKTTQYKNTPIGPIPTDWELVKIKDIGQVKRGAGSQYLEYVNEEGIRFIRINDFFEDKPVYIKDFENINNFLLNERDILFAGTGATAGAVFLPKCEWFNLPHSYNAPRIRVNANQNKSYIFLSLQSNYIEQQKHKAFVGAAQPFLDTKAINDFDIPLPPLPEQQKIAEVLSTWDKAIQETDAIIKKLENRNKALAFSLLTGKKRVKGFENEWRNLKINEVFSEVKDINDGDDVHKVLTISAKNGFVSQEDKFDRVIAGNSLKKYTLLKKGDFAYNKGNSKTYEYGCIYVLDKYPSALVPFVYICFRPTLEISIDFYKHWFFNHSLDNQLRRIITSGARGDGLLNVSKDDFFNLKVVFPSLEEQNAIAEILNTANQEVKQYQQKLEALKLQKKGLMQQLLTGKVRTV